MSDDLVKRLRWRAASNENCLCGNPVCDEAASRIEKLEAANLAQSCIKVDDQMRIEKLEAALREIAWIATPDHAMARSRATHIARKALENKNG